MKDDIDRAITYHDKRLMKKVLNVWYFTKVYNFTDNISMGVVQSQHVKYTSLLSVWSKDANCKININAANDCRTGI